MPTHPDHPDHAPAPLREISRAMRVSMLCAIVLIPAPGRALEITFYRCTAPSGETEFRQRPCEAGSKEEELTVEDRETGWVPPAGDLGPVTKQTGKERPAPRKGAPKSRPSKARREEQCWKKRKLLDEVNWRLRRGYNAGTGVKLRHRRRAYEEYIGRYCK